jgi:hypothetical protein
MDEICFWYSRPELVDSVAADLIRLAPDASLPFRDLTRSHVLHVPESLWLQPLLPELILGLGGRLVDCVPAEPDAAEANSTTDRVEAAE